MSAHSTDPQRMKAQVFSVRRHDFLAPALFLQELEVEVGSELDIDLEDYVAIEVASPPANTAPSREETPSPSLEEPGLTPPREESASIEGENSLELEINPKSPAKIEPFLHSQLSLFSPKKKSLLVSAYAAKDPDDEGVAAFEL